MKYGDFREKVVNNVAMYLPEDVRNIPVKMYKKSNFLSGTSREQWYLTFDDSIFSGMIPVDIDEEYIRYAANFDFEKTMRLIAAQLVYMYHSAESAAINRHEKGNANNGKREKIIFQLINTERNKDFLPNVPHREFLNLSVVYRIANEVGNTLASDPITNEKAKENGWDEAYLYETAMRDTPQLLKTVIVRQSEGEHIESAENLLNRPLDERRNYIITNNYLRNGSVALLDNRLLSDIADKLHSDFYVIPSSCDELIVVPVKYYKAPSLQKLLKFNNDNESLVSPENFLSNQLYVFSREEQKLSALPEIKRFKVPISWKYCGYIEIDSTSFEEAVQEVQRNPGKFDIPGVAKNVQYMRESLQVNTTGGKENVL